MLDVIEEERNDLAFKPQLFISLLSISAVIYLESQQAAVDLCSLNQSAAVIAADIRATLIASQINQ